MIVLRCTNDNGQVVDLDVIEANQPLRLDISAIENTQIGSSFGISSQTFSLPGTDKNNAFFGNLFNLGADAAVALVNSVPCQLLTDGQSVFNGKLYIDNIITDQKGYTTYQVNLVNETVDFKFQLNETLLAELDWSAYNHAYTYANITASWADGLFSGDIVYPHVNYGIPDGNTDLGDYAFATANTSRTIDNYDYALRVDQFKPSIKVKAVLDTIFDSIDYKYTSSFIESAQFDDLYMLATSYDGLGAYNENPATGSAWVYRDSGFQTFNALTDTTVNYQAEVFDNFNRFDIGTDEYTTYADGYYNFALGFNYAVTTNYSLNNNPRFFISLYRNGNVEASKTYVQVPVNGILYVPFANILLDQGDTISVHIEYQSSVGNEIITLFPGTTSTYFKVEGPASYGGGNIDMGLQFPNDLKVLDFIQGLIEKFNLVIEPVANQKNILRIEPFNDWVELGDVVDWTSKLDRSVKYKVEHPVTKLPKKYRFSDALDDDMLNNYQNRTYGNTYGEYNYQTDSDLANGEKQIGGFFAATPVKGLPTKGTNGTVVVPWLVKQEPGKYAQPFNFKPRLLHKTELKTIPNNEMYGTTTGSFSVPTGSTFFYIDDPDASGVRAVNRYVTLLPTTDSPTVFSQSLDLHYSNIGYYPFQQSAVNGQCQDGLYNRFWAQYINSLYDIDARLLTCNILLDPADIDAIKLNDKYFIDGHLYRINKINGANLVQQKSTEVELVKILPGVQNFTGRRRISTGLNPEDFEDVIVGEFGEGGSVFYVRYDDGVSVTDPDILEAVSVLDGFEAYGQTVAWNTQQPTNFNPNIFILGNSKYNETQNGVAVFGNGNIIPDNLSNSYLFGNNITINSVFSASSADTASVSPATETPFSHINVFANDAFITDSQRIVLIQPSGSRTISGSQNNVLLNPINDITESDPTGSVYTGNLYNQGTAIFKDGATITGSVDITGSLTINGTPVTPVDTGSFETKTRFNHAFAVDPTTETFATILNMTGANRGATVEYVLFSGSATNVGQLQITADGTSVAAVDQIVERAITGAPTASFTAVYNASDVNVRATFIGSDYIISGSIITMI